MEPPKKYQPSNGTEYTWFTNKYCMQCIHCNPDQDGEKQCDILLSTLFHHISDENYPIEWIYDKNENPTCTKWKEWNWQLLGDPDDPDNPNAPKIYNPNQLNLF